MAGWPTPPRCQMCGVAAGHHLLLSIARRTPPVLPRRWPPPGPRSPRQDPTAARQLPLRCRGFRGAAIAVTGGPGGGGGWLRHARGGRTTHWARRTVRRRCQLWRRCGDGGGGFCCQQAASCVRKGGCQLGTVAAALAPTVAGSRRRAGTAPPWLTRLAAREWRGRAPSRTCANVVGKGCPAARGVVARHLVTHARRQRTLGKERGGGGGVGGRLRRRGDGGRGGACCLAAGSPPAACHSAEAAVHALHSHCCRAR